MSLQDPPYKNKEAFSRLYEETHLTVYKYIFYLCGGPEQKAEDFTSETFWRAWKNRNSFKGNQKAAIGWLLQISKNLVIDEFRKQKVRGYDVDIDTVYVADGSISPEMQTAQKEQILVLMQLLGELSVEKGEILILRYGLGWRVKDIGAYLNIAENTVSAIIRRSLQSIRKNWPKVNE